MERIFRKGLKRFLLIFIYTGFAMTNQLYGQQIMADKGIRMLALGDSYTIGESVEVMERWPHQFVAGLNDLGIDAPPPDYIATTGWTTGDLIGGITRVPDWEKDYNLISILIGVNNQYQGMEIDMYEPELRTIIDLAIGIADQDTGRVFMLSIPDYAYTPYGKADSGISSEIDRYNEINRRVAKAYGIARFDITPISRRGLKEPELVAADGLHPSGKQYREWVDMLIHQLKKDQ